MEILSPCLCKQALHLKSACLTTSIVLTSKLIAEPKKRVSSIYPVVNGFISETQLSKLTSASAASQKLKDTQDIAKQFYMAQSEQILGESSQRVTVNIYLEKVTGDWQCHILKSIKEINEAAPGLELVSTLSKESAQVQIYMSSDGRCFTKNGSIWRGRSPVIHLAEQWENKERTATHELLHALGLMHEHQRNDTRNYLKTPPGEQSDQLKPNELFRGLTRFDPFSITMYNIDGEQNRAKGDNVWNIKKEGLNVKMSELDKVTLNLMYRPCKSSQYSPTKSIDGSLLQYCGRDVMANSNHPFKNFGDGKCGPNKGPNCPACRVLTSDSVKKFQDLGKWQGWTGHIYCGKRIASTPKLVGNGIWDGVCGPNNGPPCNECGKMTGTSYRK